MVYFCDVSADAVHARYLRSRREAAMTLSLTCVCCGFTREFADNEEAFNEGWDAPPHFTGYVSCDLCPAAFIMMGQMHKHDSVHERWKVEGRPSEWSQETCLAPTDRVPETELDKIRKMLGA